MLLHMADPEHRLTLEDAVALGTRRERVDTRGVAAALREAALAAQPITIEYRGHARPGGLLTTRTILVRHVNHRKVQAFCQLRNEERVFRLDRIRLL
jgi:predicted DNA-binding transcriptional regulator YafY